MLSVLLRPDRYYANARFLWAKWQVERRGLIETATPRPQDAKPASYFDLWKLYRSAKGRITVIEFGVGLSTLVLARAIHPDGRLISIDADAKWIEVTRAALPHELASRVNFHHSKLKKTSYEGEECHRYLSVPKVTPELVFLDAPMPSDVPGWDGPPMAMDPLTMDMQPGARLIVDSRTANVEFLKRHEKRAHSVSTDRTFGITTFDY